MSEKQNGYPAFLVPVIYAHPCFKCIRACFAGGKKSYHILFYFSSSSVWLSIREFQRRVQIGLFENAALNFEKRYKNSKLLE